MRPVTAVVLGSGHLQSLSHQPRWVLWRKETRKGRATKVPRTATGNHASVTDPTTWASCDQLLPPPSGMDGVGIVLGGTLGGLDLDACIQDDGTLEPWASEIVERLDTYCEVSPSGRGIKLLLRGCDMAGIESGHEVSWGEPVTMPDGTTKRRELALYPGSRFFAVTGNLWLDRPIRTVPEADLRWVLERIEQIRCDEKRSKAEQKQPFTTLPVPLPKQLQQLIQHGAPEGQRSEQFHHAVGWLRDLGYSQSGAINLLQQYPDGIAAKYSGRLPEEVARCWGKLEEPRPAMASTEPAYSAISVRSLDLYSAASLTPARDDEVFDDELVEGVMGKNSMAVLYGDSNSGKTFLAIDLCAAVAEGRPWMGRNTERGVVVYLATENPRSVEMRLKAYKRSNQTTLEWFFIIPNPVSLFNEEADVSAVMRALSQAEALTGQRVSIIVGDTLARLSTGAKENTEDMGVVLRNCDRIREASGATFLLIHHTGKDAAKGMRGWSGMRAHIDTELEVTADEATGQRCAEITKQRDLDSKGDRYGFMLEAVNVGLNRWGRRRTSCVVIPTDPPVKKGKAMKLGAAQQAILHKLLSLPAGVKRSDLVRELQTEERTASSIHNAIKRMADKGLVLEAAGVVALHGDARRTFREA